MDKETYLKAFDGLYNEETRKAQALHYALDIRKFEIELYWKRATYFWAFIAASFAGYGAVQNIREPDRTDLSVLVGCLGLVFSFAWYLINRGSKFWFVNWEKHVDVLEDEVLGPLYKVVIEERSKPAPGRLRQLATASGRYSVTKINQMISIFVVFIWILLIWRALPSFGITHPVNWFYVSALVGSLLTCLMLCLWGHTGEPKNSEIVLRLRTVTVANGGPSAPAGADPNSVGQKEKLN